MPKSSIVGRCVACAFTAAALVGCAGERTAEDFASSALVQEDGITDITTVNPPLHIAGPLDKGLERHSIRAHVDKRTGQKTFELFELVSYKGTKPKAFDHAQLRTPEGLREAALRALKPEQRCIQYRSGIVCTQLERLIVGLDESILQAIGDDKDARRAWAVELSTRSGEKYVVPMVTAEVRGLLQKVNQYTMGIRP
jgi:hypothetical protein